MHPEVRQVGPGSCPKCGMALEPLEPVAEEEPNAELADMTRRFWIGVALTVPILALEMGGIALPDVVGRLSVTARLWIQLVLADAGGALGRLALLRPRLAVGGDAQPEHVHPDRPRHWGGLRL